jgi:transposase-like protein
MVKYCPKCRARNNGSRRFYTKQGYFKTKHDHQPVPRYRCKHCGANFSSHTFRDTYRQHKPRLNRKVYKLLCSGVTFRRSAKILRVSRNTVTAKFHWLCAKARKCHVRALKTWRGSVTTVEFDEMESYQGSRLNMLSLSMAVEKERGLILDARVALMRPKGMLAKKCPKARLRWNQDTRKEASTSVLRRVNRLAGGRVTIRCDGKPQYRTLIKDNVRSYFIEICSREPGHPETWRRTNYFNHVAAKIRADLARMKRRTWACTRKWQNLQKHLYLYMAWNNQYKVA